MGKDDENFNPGKERPGYGISHSNYAPVHRKSDPGGLYEKQRTPDERISREISKRLSAVPTLDASEVRVVVSCGEAMVDGIVSNNEQRRLVEEIVCGTPEVSACENDLRIGKKSI